MDFDVYNGSGLQLPETALSFAHCSKLFVAQFSFCLSYLHDHKGVEQTGVPAGENLAA